MSKTKEEKEQKKLLKMKAKKEKEKLKRIKKIEKQKNKFKHDHSIDDGCNGLLDLILPDSVKEYEDYIKLDNNRYFRMFAVSSYPKEVYLGIFADLLDIKGVSISSYSQAVKNKDILKKLQDKITKIKSNVIMEENRRTEVDYAKLEVIADLDNLRKLIQTGQEKMYSNQVLVMIGAEDLKELDKRSKQLKDVCEEKVFKVRLLMHKQLSSFLTALPFCNIKQHKYIRNTTTGGVMSNIPIGNIEVHEGVFVGFNKYTNAPVLWDCYNRSTSSNPMTLVAGIAGSGKSVFMKLVAARSAARQEFVFMLDLDGEYEKLVNFIGGKYVTLKSGEKSGINPLELEITTTETGQKRVDIYEKISEIRDSLNMFCEEFRSNKLEGKELTTLEQAIKQIYKDRGINENIESLYNGFDNKKKMPTWNDLRIELQKYDSTCELAELMKLITSDGSLGIFDCESTVNIDFNANNIICISLRHIKDRFMKFYSIINVLTWVWNKFGKWEYRSVKKKFLIDEGWYFTKYIEAQSYLENMARRGRKYKSALIIATQSLGEFLSSESGRAILDQIATKFFLRQDNLKLIEKIGDFYGISEQCKEEIYNFEDGQAVFQQESQTKIIDIKFFDFEEEYVITDDKKNTTKKEVV